MTPERLTAARARHQECETAAARVATAATRLDFKLSDGRHVRAGGVAIDTDLPLRLTRPTELELEGFGRLVVTPGGEDLDARQHSLRSAQSALADALAALGVASLGEADAAMDRRREAESALRHCEAEIKAILQANAARSLEALGQLQADRRPSSPAIRDRLGLDVDAPDPASLEARAAAGAIDRLRAQEILQTARVAVHEADRRLASAEAEAAGIGGEELAASRARGRAAGSPGP